MKRSTLRLSAAKWSASGVLREVLPPPIVTACSGGRPQLGQAQNMSGWRTPPATNCSGTRDRACQCIACAAPGLQPAACASPASSSVAAHNAAAETCAALRNTSNPLDHLHPNARTALCDDVEAASRPRPPANAWLGTCVTGLQLPASPRPTSRPHSCSEQRSGARRVAGHLTAVLRPAECTSHSARRRAR